MAIASLGMYAPPALTKATEAWWAGLAQAFRAAGLRDVPAALDGGDMRDHWGDPDLLFGQTCGYPLTHDFAGKLRVVATPRYAAAGCEGSRYRSAVIVRADEPAESLADFAGRKAATNSRDSQSGHSAFRHAVAQVAGGDCFFSEVVMSGGHRGSMLAVAESRADIAAVDCVTLALHQRHEPELTAALRTLTYTEAAPGLPYVTAARRGADEVERLRAGLLVACDDPALAEVRAALLIEGVEVLPEDAYERIDQMEREAVALGYPALC